MKQDKTTIKTYFETGDKPTQEQYSNLVDSYIDSKQIEGEANRRFVIDQAGEVSIASEQKTPEYTLSEITGNKLALLKDGITVKEIDLTPYIDDTNLSRLVSGTVDANGVATFTRDDNSTFTVDLSNLKNTQIQSDFNQTDNTQPDYIKGAPLSVLDHNAMEKFNGKKIQFGKLFNFDIPKNEVNIITDNFVFIPYKNSNLSYTRHDKAISEKLTTISSDSDISILPDNGVSMAKLIDKFTWSVLGGTGTETPTFNLTVYLEIINGNFSSDATGTSLFKEIKLYSTPINKTTFGNKEIIILSYLGWHSVLNINEKDYSLDGSFSESLKGYYIRNLNNDNMLKPSECKFKFKYVTDVNYADTTNTNGNNQNILCLYENLSTRIEAIKQN